MCSGQCRLVHSVPNNSPFVKVTQFTERGLWNSQSGYKLETDSLIKSWNCHVLLLTSNRDLVKISRPTHLEGLCFAVMIFPFTFFNKSQAVQKLRIAVFKTELKPSQITCEGCWLSKLTVDFLHYSLIRKKKIAICKQSCQI